ncbi:hypothetical protein NP569_27380, partial [Vibrio parahaemolyticus]|nr:hypothetical protein [Vibrio parahaemolyticus]
MDAGCSIKLLESDVSGLLAEASTSEIEAVLADKSVVSSADAAGAGSWSELAWVREPQILETHCRE